MPKSKIFALFVSVAFCCFAAATSYAQTLTVQFLGPSQIVGTAADVDLREGTNISFGALGVDGTDFICFEVPMVDTSTDVGIGSGVDCLRFDDANGMNVTENTLTVAVFTFFIFPGGTVVHFGATTIQPFVSGFGDGFIGGNPDNHQVTHLTGAIPSGADSIMAVTGRFSRRSGHARVSGAVSVTPLDPENNIGPSFDCLWEVTLDPSRGQGKP